MKYEQAINSGWQLLTRFIKQRAAAIPQNLEVGGVADPPEDLERGITANNDFAGESNVLSNSKAVKIF